ARLQRQTAAADAGRQAVADRFERRDPRIELGAPRAREPLPIALRRLLSRGEAVEGGTDPPERDAGRLPRLDQGDAAKRDSRVAALVPAGPPRNDQALALVETEGRGGHSAAPRQLCDRQRLSYLT